MESPQTPEIIELQALYNAANELLRQSPLFIAKEEAGQALQAAHARLKEARTAARDAARTASFLPVQKKGKTMNLMGTIYLIPLTNVRELSIFKWELYS